MALTATFFKCGKKLNSTLRPGSSDPGSETFSIVLKDGCSVTHPVIEVVLSPDSVPSWNYAQISDFNRYYFIESWTRELGRWVAVLNVDVLATYKNQIGLTDMYCLRSSYESDGTITDTLYPIKNEYSWARSTGSLVPNYNSGRFVVGIVGRVAGTTPLGGISYVQMTAAQFKDFKDKLFSDDIAYCYHGSQTYDQGLEEVGNSFAKLMFKPFEYVVSCCWIPAPAPQSGWATGWNVGFWTFLSSQGNLGILDPTDCIASNSVQLTLPKRNDARGKYLEASPYTDLKLFIPTVGLVSLDSEKLINASSIYVTYYADPVSMKSFVKVEYREGTDLVTVGMYPAGFAVPLTLAQSGVTIASIGSNVMNAAIDLLPALTGAVGAGVAAASVAKGSISSAQGIFAPNIQRSGDTGCFASLSMPVNLDAFFWKVAPENNTQFGRPLCQTRKPSLAPGYFQALRGEVHPATSTQEENEELNKMMENGFYYE